MSVVLSRNNTDSARSHERQAGAEIRELTLLAYILRQPKLSALPTPSRGSSA